MRPLRGPALAGRSAPYCTVIQACMAAPGSRRAYGPSSRALDRRGLAAADHNRYAARPGALGPGAVVRRRRCGGGCGALRRLALSGAGAARRSPGPVPPLPGPGRLAVAPVARPRCVGGPGVSGAGLPVVARLPGPPGPCSAAAGAPAGPPLARRRQPLAACGPASGGPFLAAAAAPCGALGIVPPAPGTPRPVPGA